MRILLVTETIHAGGAETFVLRLARSLCRAGAQAEVLSLNPDLHNPALLAQYADLRIHQVRLPALRWIKRADRLLKMTGLDFSLQDWLNRRIIAKKHLAGQDVIHSHLFPVDLLFSRLRAAHPAVRIVSTLHGDYDEYEAATSAGSAKRVLNWKEKVELVKGRVGRWVYISKNQYSLFRETFRLPTEKMVKIYNGYEPPAALPERADGAGSKSGLTFIMVARGIREKGWDYLLAAFKRLPAGHRLVLVGTGPYLDELRAQHGGDASIDFAGFHPNPVELIRQADVFVFPSVYKAESLPTVLIESLYAGVPVISTRIGEVEELLTDESTGAMAGLLIEQGGSEEMTAALTAAMQRYAAEPALRQEHLRAAAGAFHKFDMDHCARRYLDVYRQATTDSTL